MKQIITNSHVSEGQTKEVTLHYLSEGPEIGTSE